RTFANVNSSAMIARQPSVPNLIMVTRPISHVAVPLFARTDKASALSVNRRLCFDRSCAAFAVTPVILEPRRMEGATNHQKQKSPRSIGDSPAELPNGDGTW